MASITIKGDTIRAELRDALLSAGLSQIEVESQIDAIIGGARMAISEGEDITQMADDFIREPFASAVLDTAKRRAAAKILIKLAREGE